MCIRRWLFFRCYVSAYEMDEVALPATANVSDNLLFARNQLSNHAASVWIIVRYIYNVRLPVVLYHSTGVVVLGLMVCIVLHMLVASCLRRSASSNSGQVDWVASDWSDGSIEPRNQPKPYYAAEFSKVECSQGDLYSLYIVIQR